MRRLWPASLVGIGEGVPRAPEAEVNFTLTLPMALTVCARLTWVFPLPAVPAVTGGCPAPVVIPGGPERPARPLTSSRPSR